MGYRIAYESFGEEKKFPTYWRRKSAIAAGLLVIVLVVGAVSVKYTGLRWVQDYLLPGDPAVTAAALENFAQDLKEGESVKDAITAFCREIMDHGTNID